jgi:DNA-directed RNA polymerase beta' subunit
MRSIVEPGRQRSWKAEFARSAEGRRDEQRQLVEADRKRTKDIEKAHRLDDEVTDFALSMVLATESDIADLTRNLDIYDEATVKALMKNGERMDEARRELDEMLAKAHVLPDGRRVFESKDGIHVFDEHGVELSPDVIDLNEIADWRTKWEDYKTGIDSYDRIVEEREKILEFQAEVDQVREEVEKGDLTKAKLDELGDRLSDNMPEIVRAQLPEQERNKTLAADAASPEPSEPVIIAPAARPFGLQ